MNTKLNVEEELDLLADYFSDEAIDSFTNNLPQETYDELIQVMSLVDKKLKRGTAQARK